RVQLQPRNPGHTVAPGLPIRRIHLSHLHRRPCQGLLFLEKRQPHGRGEGKAQRPLRQVQRRLPAPQALPLGRIRRHPGNPRDHHAGFPHPDPPELCPLPVAFLQGRGRTLFPHGLGTVPPARRAALPAAASPGFPGQGQGSAAFLLSRHGYGNGRKAGVLRHSGRIHQEQLRAHHHGTARPRIPGRNRPADQAHAPALGRGCLPRAGGRLKVGIVGAGMLGLTLGHRLARAGHTVEIFESGGQSGGLAAPHDYGSFVWDRYYHCILPQDQNLIRLLAELGLEDDLRWRTTGTGYYGKGVFHNMSGNKDFLAFPLLSLADKFRLGATIFYATRFADPYKLYRVTAKDWLTRTCGRKVYEVFWLPLLKAKFGPFHDQIAAVFIWAALTRLLGAGEGGANKENLGYVRGGYGAVLGKLEAWLASHGAKLRLDSPIAAARPGRGGEAACVLETSGPEGECKTFGFDQVFFTAPTSLAAKVSAPEFQPHIRRMATDYPTSGAYLGVICLVLVLKKPLTPYYVLNIGEDLGLTGVIEMTNLIDAAG